MRDRRIIPRSPADKEARSLKGKKIVIVGAGNVGMDVAAQALRPGAAEVRVVDIQKPAAFGRELQLAQSLGTEVLWPRFVKRYVKKEKKIYFTDGTALDADAVFLAVDDLPDPDFLPPASTPARLARLQPTRLTTLLIPGCLPSSTW